MPSAASNLPSSQIAGDSRAPSVSMAPLALVLIALCAGIGIDRHVDPFETGTWITLALASITVACLGLRRDLLSTVALLAAILAGGGGWHHFRWNDLVPDDLSWGASETPRPAWARGVITELMGIRRSEGYGPGDPDRVVTRLALEITGISDGSVWRGASGGALVIVAGVRNDLYAGQPVELAGQLARVAGPLNPGEFDHRAYLRARGIRLRITVDNPAGIAFDPRGSEWQWARWLGDLRASCRARLVEQLDSRTAPLASALILGQREDIDPEVNDAFARTGTTHLLAISGLQIQVLAFSLGLVLRAVGLPRRLAYGGVALVTLGYAILVGLAPSVVRSAVMTLTFCVAAIVSRPNRPANTLALAGLFTLAWNPFFLFDVGCQLSFLAIGALIWLVPAAQQGLRALTASIRSVLRAPPSPLEDLERRYEPWWTTSLRRLGSWIAQGILTSAVVWLAALPLVALRFHLVSSIGILLNIPLIPLTSLALLLGAAGMGLGMVWSPLGVLPIQAADALLRLTEVIVRWGALQSWGHRFVAGPSWGTVVGFYVLLVLATVAVAAGVRNTVSPRLRSWRFALWGAVVLSTLPGWLLGGLGRTAATMEGDLLAIGHGLAVVFQLPDGRALLYDCGRMGDPRVGRRIIAPALWSRGVTRLDSVYLSHADQDHYNALPDLLDRFKIGELVIPPGFVSEQNPGASLLLDQLRTRGIPVRTIAAPATWDQAGAHFTVLHPPADWHPETPDNARSLVLDVAQAGRHLLLTGDLDQLGLIELASGPQPDHPIDLMLSPHHGGKSANPAWLFSWARPRTIVVSQRPPTPGATDALTPLERAGTPVLRTWRRGAIHFRWTPDGIVTQGFLDLDNSRPIPGRPTEQEAASGRVFAMLLSFPWLLQDTGGRIMIGITGFLLGVIACALLAVVEYGAWSLVLPPRAQGKADDTAELASEAAGGQMNRSRPISALADDGVKLAGLWHPAAGMEGTGRTAILLHGFAEASLAVQSRRVAALNQGSWNVAALDLRGYGRSSGSLASFGGREVGDVRVWLDTLAGQPGRAHPLLPALWGRSMGAAIAVRAAAEDTRIRALVLESPMVDLEEAMAVWFRKRRFPCAQILARLVTWRAGELAGVSLTRPRPLEVAPRVHCPVLIVHGGDDTLVTSHEARRLAGAFPNPPEFIEVPGAGHADVVAIAGDALLERIIQFLQEASVTVPL